MFLNAPAGADRFRSFAFELKRRAAFEIWISLRRTIEGRGRALVFNKIKYVYDSPVFTNSDFVTELVEYDMLHQCY